MVLLDYIQLIIHVIDLLWITLYSLIMIIIMIQCLQLQLPCYALLIFMLKDHYFLVGRPLPHLDDPLPHKLCGNLYKQIVLILCSERSWKCFVLPLHRHPVHSKRPRFSEICDYFKTPTKQLLWWNDEDNVTSQQARTLGAPLSESQLLFQDLQNVYKSIGSI